MRVLALLAVVLVLGCAYLILSRQDAFDSEVAPANDAPSAAESRDTGNARDVSLTPGAAPRAKTSETPSSEEPNSEGTFVATGRVLDATRQPVKGALVIASRVGQELGRATTGKDGTYRLSMSPSLMGLVTIGMRATSGKRTASGALYLGTALGVALDPLERTVVDLVLRDGQPLSLRVVHEGKPVAGAVVYAQEAQSASVIAGAPIAAPNTDDEGKTRIPLVSGQLVAVYAAAEGYGRAYQKIQIPCRDVVDVELPKDRTITVRVVEAGSNAPVEGAEVHLAGEGTHPIPRGIGCLPPMKPIATGADGRAVISGAPPTHIWVVARAPELAMLNQGWSVERAILQKNDHEITVTLHRYTTLRFPVTESDVASPASGTALKLVQYQGLNNYYQSSPTARFEEDHIIIEEFPPGHDWGHVIAPNGTWASWQVPAAGKPAVPTRFRHACDFTVQATWTDGTPAEGVSLSLWMQPRGQQGPLKTNDKGVVTFEGCCAETANVRWNLAAPGNWGLTVGEGALSGRTKSIDVTLAPTVPVTVDVTIDGEPGLPPSYRISAPPLHGERAVGVGQPIISEDPVAGRLFFSWPLQPAAEQPSITFTSAGYPEVKATLVRESDGKWTAEVKLETASTLRVRIKKDEGRKAWLRVERWHEQYGRFHYLHDDPAYQAGRRPVSGVYTFRGFSPGRYRLIDGYSGIASDPFEIVTGSEPMEIAFDITDAVTVQGRVVVPKGHQPAFARIHVAGRTSGRLSVSNSIRVGTDGRFEFHGRRGETLPLAVNHPVLSLKEPHVEFEVGSGELILPLVEGPTVTFRVAGSTATTPAPKPGVHVSPTSLVFVRIVASLDALSTPEAIRDAPYSQTLANEGRFLCKAPKPGRWFILLHHMGNVPHLLRDVEIGTGTTDLGTISFSKGATLTVEFQKGAAPMPMAVAVRATHQKAPAYVVSSFGRPDGVKAGATLSGLGAGRFKLVCQAVGKREVIHSEEIESDGTTAIKLIVPLP